VEQNKTERSIKNLVVALPTAACCSRHGGGPSPIGGATGTSAAGIWCRAGVEGGG
jgi:hypothetical protein